MAFVDDFKGVLIDQNPDFQSVTSGGKAFARIPPGQTLLLSQLVPTIAGVAATDAQIAAQIDAIRVIIDGVVKFELSGADAMMLANFYRPDRVANDGILPIFWARTWLENPLNQDAPAYGLKGVDSASIEVKFANGSTIDKLLMFHETAEAEPLGDHVVTGRVNYSYTATGLQTINDLPTDPSWVLHALHFTYASTAVLKQVELIADRIRVLIGTPQTLNARYKYRNVRRAPQAGYFHLDFCARNRVIDALPLTMNQLQLRLTWATAAESAGATAPGTLGVISEIAQVQAVKGKAA
jgi:hypothetical protein